jgi:hypothetical protein
MGFSPGGSTRQQNGLRRFIFDSPRTLLAPKFAYEDAFTYASSSRFPKTESPYDFVAFSLDNL